MKRRRVILLTVGAVLITTVLLLSREKEPEYNGKKLNEWLSQYEFSEGPDVVEKMREAADAVHLIGEKALPCLVRWTTTQPAPWRSKVAYAINRCTQRFLRWRFVDSSPGLYLLGLSEELKNRLGLRGFEILGTEARPAIFQLSKIAENTDSAGGAAYRAMMALDRMGAARPWLGVLTNTAGVPASFRTAYEELLRSDFPSLRHFSASNVLQRIPPEVMEVERRTDEH